MTRRRQLPALALFLLLLLAGCTARSDLFTPQSAKVHRFDGHLTFHGPVAYNGTGAMRPLPAAMAGDALPRSVEQMVGKVGGEPNLGVTSTGSLFVNTFDQTQRSRDHGQSWETVFDYRTPGAPVTEDLSSTADPMLWVDTDTDRVFVDHMEQVGFDFCTYLSWSDDDGATWVERPAACGIPHIDHQKLMSAHWGPGVPKPPVTPLYPNVLHLCTNDQEIGTWCTQSYDGGLTWLQQREVIPEDVLCANINGHPGAWPDGTVGVPIGGGLGGPDCHRPPTVDVSTDNGLTWTQRICRPDLRQVEIDPDLTVTPDGTAYLLFRDQDQLHYLLRSKDQFQTCDLFRISPPGHTVGVFAGITSGDDGKISMAWLGTRDPQRPGTIPSNATGGTLWHAFVTTSLDAAAKDPTFVTQQVTPDEDPVQVGCIWVGGGGGGPHRCRNLLDFIDMVHDKEGRTYVSITDGCVPRNGCSGDIDSIEYQSRDSQVAILVQDHGLGLVGETPLPPLGLRPPMPFPE